MPISSAMSVRLRDALPAEKHSMTRIPRASEETISFLETFVSIIDTPVPPSVTYISEFPNQSAVGCRGGRHVPSSCRVGIVPVAVVRFSTDTSLRAERLAGHPGHRDRPGRQLPHGVRADRGDAHRPRAG